MKPTLSSVSICRTPIFPVHTKLENVWQELKGYIHESSPAFFEVIKEYDYPDLELAEPKTRFTVWKYFNRAKFRATPYGNFATFSLVPVGRENEPGHLTLLKTPVLHRFANWQEKENISFDPRWLTHNAGYFMANTTIYECDDELRYLNVENGGFELSAVMNEETTKAVIHFCHSKRTLQEIQAFLKQHSISRSMTNYLVEQLVSFQLLLTDFQPNIIGRDYFSRIGHVPAAKKNDYIIAERKLSSGHLPEKSLQVFLEVADFLNKNNLANSNASMDDFREKFVRRFEDKEVPLLTAMDPEIGIGYKSLIQDKDEDPLVQELKASGNDRQHTTQRLNYSALHQFILNRFIAQKTVQLEEFKSHQTRPALAIANTISILFHQSDQHMVIEQIGGCTANALLGRFTMANEEVTALAHKFAKTEQQANPDVIFFDIAYQIEKNADNINRRKSVYRYELPILSWAETENILDADDVMVSVRGTELILRSVKYGKRVVPKLASAYNYSRSDLAVYRFLSDLQHQNLHSSLGINITQIFPGLVHYQRIQYKNVILSPEKWQIPAHICNGADPRQSLTELTNWLLDIKLQRPFKCGFADQNLLFNPSVKEDLNAFLLFCKNKKDLYIEEAFIPASSLVKDENDNAYLSEFIINLEHGQQLYQPCLTNDHREAKHHASGAFIPGEEWLYFEIYCHPSRSNSILQDIAGSFLTIFRKKIKTWFFIRYTDPANHIRLRVKLKDLADAGQLSSGLARVLKPYINTGIIADLQLKTYRPETKRYGADRMELVEKCFHVNSDLVLEIIGKPVKINALYALSMQLIEQVWQHADFTLNQQLLFAEDMADHFTAEMNINPDGFKRINQGFKDFSNEPNRLSFNKLQNRKIIKTEKYFIETLKACGPAGKNKMLSDLFHMHTNRLFSSDQRMHEMIMYYYLTRNLKMKIGRMKKESAVII